MKKTYLILFGIYTITITAFSTPIVSSSYEFKTNTQNDLYNSEQTRNLRPPNEDISFKTATKLPLVATTSGLVEAHFKSGVYIWEDIPYAKPPIGDLRWRAPRKLDSS